MNPTKFVELAGELVQGRNEAALRTAVSRAYYGAFHAAALLIKEMGVSLPVGPESHQKVRFCLKESRETPAVYAGRFLQILREDRNRADYDLESSDGLDTKNVMHRVNQARVIIDQLQKCREEPTRSRLRVMVREYASNVLRLPVSDQ